MLQLRELEKMNPDQKAEISALRSDNARLKQTSDSLRDQVAQLQSKVWSVVNFGLFNSQELKWVHFIKVLFLLELWFLSIVCIFNGSQFDGTRAYLTNYLIPRCQSPRKYLICKIIHLLQCFEQCCWPNEWKKGSWYSVRRLPDCLLLVPKGFAMIQVFWKPFQHREVFFKL